MSGRILLVDDERDILAIAKIALERLGGWTVTTAGSGPEALGSVERERPDVILLDGAMPGMDGLAVLRALRASQATREIPVIFLTASVQTTETKTFLEAGGLGVIAKPFDPMTLHDEVARLLGQRA